jgi:hypothetical protein
MEERVNSCRSYPRSTQLNLEFLDLWSHSKPLLQTSCSAKELEIYFIMSGLFELAQQQSLRVECIIGLSHSKNVPYMFMLKL